MTRITAFFIAKKRENIAMYEPDFETFTGMSEAGNLIPVYREILADTETPVSALMKMSARSHVFLLESVEGGEKWGRYTFLGADPQLIFTVRGDEVVIEKDGEARAIPHRGNPLAHLKNLLDGYRPVPLPGLPRFFGGAVGFLGYDMVRHFEKLPCRHPADAGLPDAVFLVTGTLVIFDNVRHTIKIVACVTVNDGDDLRALYESAAGRIESTVDLLRAPERPAGNRPGTAAGIELRPNMTRDGFKSLVDRAREYIAAGDIIQVVLSQRFTGQCGLDPVDLYRALRYTNPSPYLFFLKTGGMALIGSSPEVMVRLEEGVVELKPIAGTRRRGATEQEDRRLADELLADPKERAEHVMLVDLGRNDLGRIARIGSVQVNQLMAVERYSHVMHLVSHIQAQLAPGNDAFDVLRATFPAGTLTGAPKVRAMEIIEELEPARRGPYGGAVGYFSFSGNMDFCITIRTVLIHDGKASLQVGAGIVADSSPEAEHRECLGKAAAMMQAVRLVEAGFNLKSKEKEK
ncbi:MAG: Anthranilate synthase component 1 [Syntrophaceae bacterium PtaB.Bin095]|nr:MAG: Anthranilate synthase component 1 [Syntrophaceae bacterium PtaB.Bin095]